MKLPRLRGSIAARIFISLVGVSYLCIILAVASLSVQSAGALRSTIADRNIEIARQAALEISRYISDSIDELSALNTLLSPFPSDAFVRTAVLSNMTLEFEKYRQLAIVGSDGSILADSRMGEANQDLLDPSSIKPLLSDRVLASPVKVARDFTPYMLVASPMRPPDRNKGWLVGALYLRDIWSLVDQISVGDSGAAYLVSNSGTLISHPDKTRVLSSAQTAAPPANLSKDGLVRTETEPGNKRFLTAYAPVPEAGWAVAVQQPLSDAFLPAQTIVRQSILLLLLGLILSLTLGLFISRAISLPLVELVEGTRKISEGNLQYYVTARGTDEIGRVAASFNAMVDSLRARTAQLMESEQQYRMVAEGVNDIIFTLDAEGRVTYVNPRLKSILGVDPSLALGVSVVEKIDEHERERAWLMQKDLLEATGLVEREGQFEITSRDGKRIVLDVHLTAQEGPGDRRLVFGVARDATERVKLLEQLTQAQKMEAVGRLAGGVAHDFNNLLTAILGYCDYSRQVLSDPVALSKNLEEIRKAGTRAASLTQQLLAFSRRQVMRPRIIDLNQLILNLEKLLMRLLGEDIVLTSRLAPNLGSILADPGQIEQVVMNLCINSRDALPHGGEIVLATGNETLSEPRKVDRFTIESGEYVRLSVTDNGIGMGEDVKSHLFEPFFTTKEVGKGTGLGLSTVYGIVKQTSGYISAESAPGRGTTFDILFPRSTRPAEGPLETRGQRSSGGGSETILLVEDEATIRGLVKNVLGGRGYTVHEAVDAESALAVFGAHGTSIDLVVTDVVLPGASGRELVERLVKVQPSLAALLVSGYTPEIMDHHGVLKGSIAFLQKPFTPDGLLTKVREVLDLRHPR